MTRIAWQYENASGGWNGKVGERVTFWLRPDGDTWKLVFTWTNGVFDGFPNISAARDVAERKLVLFAEQTGITLPDVVVEEEGPSLAQSLVKGFLGEMHWFKDGDSPERRAEYLGTQALVQVEELIRKHRVAVDDEVKDPEYHGAIGVLRDLVEEVWEAQEELGLEVERNWPED